MSLEWNGARLLERLRHASAAAVNSVLDDCVVDAGMSHPWINRTGQLEEEIKAEHATPGQANPTGRFGTTRRRGFYGLFHERGTKLEHERPFLRPAADRHFPRLGGRIKERLR